MAQNLELIRQKNLQRKVEKQAEELLSVKFRKDTEDFMKKVREDRVRDQQTKFEYRQSLDLQRGSSSHAARYSDYGDRDNVLNGQLLRTITSDDNLFSKVLARTTMRPAR